MEQNNNIDPGPGGSSTGMPQAAELVLAYLFGWLGGLIFYLIEKKNRFVRFNAAQSLIASASVTIVTVVLNSIRVFPFTALATLLGLAYFALEIYLIIRSVQGNLVKLPVVGDYAEKMAEQP